VKSGQADRQAVLDPSTDQPISDHELRTAIEELKRSTANVEKQTEILKAQQSALRSLIETEHQARELRTKVEEGQLRTWEDARSRTTRQVEELAQTLAYKITELEQQDKDVRVCVKQRIDSTLKEDDKLLLSLQKLAADLEPVKSENTDTLGKIQELCARLIKHTVEGVRTKLDRVYLEELGNGLVSNSVQNDAQEAIDLQEELESLYAEILPVAQMSTEQQFLEPARKIVANTDGRAHERATKAFEYVSILVIVEGSSR
jgi:gamma-glutamyl:cysteine ligase YbdK (ATP-grasp superfamily)